MAFASSNFIRFRCVNWQEELINHVSATAWQRAQEKATTMVNEAKNTNLDSRLLLNGEKTSQNPSWVREVIGDDGNGDDDCGVASWYESRLV